MVQPSVNFHHLGLNKMTHKFQQFPSDMAKMTIHGHGTICNQNGQLGYPCKKLKKYSLGKGRSKKNQNPGIARKGRDVCPLARFLGRFDTVHREPHKAMTQPKK